MQRNLIGALALCVAIAATGCSKKSESAPEQKPGNQGPAVENPTTTPQTQTPEVKLPALKYTRTCTDGRPETDCAGRYGFTVYSDGSYLVGPGPQGQVRKGQLTAEEAKALSGFTTSEIFGISSFADLSCGEEGTWAESYGYTFTLGLEHDGQEAKPLAKAEGAKGCYLASSFENWDKANELDTTLSKIAETYAANFPNVGLEAANALELMYAEYQSCEEDNDCAYISNNGFGIAAPGETVYGKGGQVKPMLVGNAKLLANGGRDKLAAALKLATDNGVDATCTYDSFVVEADKPAVCDKTAKKCTFHKDLVRY